MIGYEPFTEVPSFFTDRNISWHQLLQFAVYEHLESPRNLVVHPTTIVLPKMRCRLYVMLPTVTRKVSRNQRRMIVSNVLNCQIGYMDSRFSILLTNEMITVS
jgi:hypothetical protein